MPIYKNAHLLLAVTTFIWAGNAIAGKFAIGHVSPMVLTLARWLIAFFAISLFARSHIVRDWPKIKTNWVYLFLMGGIGYTGFNFLLYSALQHTSAINVALEQSAMPLVIFAGNYLLYRTGITWLQIAGYTLTAVGVVVTISAGDPMSLFGAESAGINRGDLIMALAAICYGGYSVALRAKPEMHWISFLTCLIAGAVVFAVFGVVGEGLYGANQWPTTTQGFMVCLFAGIFPSLVSQGFFIQGVEQLGANLAGLYINLVPIFAALLAVSLLGEILSLYHAFAFILVIGGILLAQSTTARRQ